MNKGIGGDSGCALAPQSRSPGFEFINQKPPLRVQNCPNKIGT